MPKEAKEVPDKAFRNGVHVITFHELERLSMADLKARHERIKAYERGEIKECGCEWHVALDA